MKQIFDDIRKEIDIHSDEACFLPDDMMVVSENEMKKIIDEAEAKWETDCCEWKGYQYSIDIIEDTVMWAYETTCKKYIAEERVSKLFKFCPYCGKPIKISEVE